MSLALLVLHDQDVVRPYMRLALPRPFERVAYRFIAPATLHARTEQQFLQAIQPGEIAYAWPNTTVATYERLKARGHKIVTECVNCHSYTKASNLEDAYARLGWPAQPIFKPGAMEAEAQRLRLSDFVFAPNACVAQSMLDAGIPEQRVVRVSYGWDPARVAGNNEPPLPRPKRTDGITVAFLGRVCVRKGAPQLLRAWAEASIPGRLVLAGTIDEEIRQRMPEYLDRDDVVCPGFVQNVSRILRSADVFVFPSLEEGGPVVTLEAMACGLPVIVSPMGAGTAVRDGQDGFIIDPHDHEAWVDRLRLLAGDASVRREMGAWACEQAQAFVWPRVAERRMEQLKHRLHPVCCPVA